MTAQQELNCMKLAEKGDLSQFDNYTRALKGLSQDDYKQIEKRRLILIKASNLSDAGSSAAADPTDNNRA